MHQKIEHKFSILVQMPNNAWEDAGSAENLATALNLAAVAERMYQAPVRVLENGAPVFAYSRQELWN